MTAPAPLSGSSSSVKTTTQDFPLRDNVPTGKAADYHLRPDTLTVSIIAVLVIASTAVMACCLRLVYTRLVYTISQQPEPSATPTAAPVPQAGVAGDRSDIGAGHGRYTSMTSVIQPNDEVAIAMRLYPESAGALREACASSAAQQSATSASPVHDTCSDIQGPLASDARLPSPPWH